MAAMRLAGAPVSWGVFELTAERPDLPGPDLVCDEAVQAGFRGLELGPPGFLGSPAETRARLGRRDLALVGSFLPLRFGRPGFAEDLAWLDGMLEFLADAAGDDARPYAVLADAASPERMAIAGRAGRHPELLLAGERLARLADDVNAAGRRCRAAGFEAVFHSHAGSYVETDAEIRGLAACLDPADVGICLDTGHARVGGADPTTLLEDLGPLVRHVHVKDVDPGVLADLAADRYGMAEAWRRGVFTELGRGVAGIDRFVPALLRSGYAGWVVLEQDRILAPGDAADVLPAQRRSLAFMAGLGLAEPGRPSRAS